MTASLTQPQRSGTNPRKSELKTDLSRSNLSPTKSNQVQPSPTLLRKNIFFSRAFHQPSTINHPQNSNPLQPSPTLSNPLKDPLPPGGGSSSRTRGLTHFRLCRTLKITLSALAVLLFAISVFAADDQSTATNTTPGQADAKYTATLQARSADIIKVLALDDTNKATKVQDVIIAQYRALNAWHNTNDAKLKAVRSDKAATAQIRASLKVLHDNYLAALAKYLTPQQIEQVKDKMTYGKVQFTYQGYCNQYLNLSDGNKQEILRLLKEAREDAMDGGSSKEKTAIFQRYKGIINNYLSKQGLHPDKT